MALTGFERARSIVASIAGDHEAAAHIELALPETGVCGGSGHDDEQPGADGGCCSPAAGGELFTIARTARPSA